MQSTFRAANQAARNRPSLAQRAVRACLLFHFQDIGGMDRDPVKRFRVTARDNNGVIFAFESDNRERAEKKHRQLQKRPELHDVRLERQRWL